MATLPTHLFVGRSITVRLYMHKIDCVRIEYAKFNIARQRLLPSRPVPLADKRPNNKHVRHVFISFPIDRGVKQIRTMPTIYCTCTYLLDHAKAGCNKCATVACVVQRHRASAEDKHRDKHGRHGIFIVLQYFS